MTEEEVEIVRGLETALTLCRTSREFNRTALLDLRAKLVAVVEEYEREPRLIASGAVAEMLREWTGDYR